MPEQNIPRTTSNDGDTTLLRNSINEINDGVYIYLA